MPLPLVSPPELLVLLDLRLTSLAEPATIAERTGIDEAHVDLLLVEISTEGWSHYREGRLHGWALTAAGRRACHERLAAELDGAGLRGPLREVYERFLAFNGPLLAACTAWQLRYLGGEPLVNDHTDVDYDRSCIERLVELHGKVEPVVVDLGELLARFAVYPGRLELALERLQEGGGEYFTSPGVDSYHTVWFELHEHLLATLGLERADELPDGSAPDGPPEGSAP